MTAVWHSWPVYLARYYAKQTWRDMPGPAPVKIALVVACLLIPGPQDELLLIAFTRACRAWRKRKGG